MARVVSHEVIHDLWYNFSTQEFMSHLNAFLLAKLIGYTM